MGAPSPVRRKKRHYRNESVRPAFEIECEYDEDGKPFDGEHLIEYIAFNDFQKLEAEDGFSFLSVSQSDPKKALQKLVGDDQWHRFWVTEGWQHETFESVQDLMSDVIEHYSGASRGNSSSSPRS